MKKWLTLFAVCGYLSSTAQELFVFTEPASNMPRNSLGVRVNNRLMTGSMDKGYRLEPELMAGLSRKLMLHLALYAANIYSAKLKTEGGSVYMKYRLLSNDAVHAHFRMAAFAKASVSNEPVQRFPYNDIDLDGNNSGWQLGVVATRLINKLALSSSVSYLNAMNNFNGNKLDVTQPHHAANYSFSAGYLLFPKEYTSYRQTNVNIMVEYLGQQFINNKGGYNEVCPAIQFIFNSIARLDIGAKYTVWSTAEKMFRNTYLVRLEYNFLNLFK